MKKNKSDSITKNAMEAQISIFQDSQSHGSFKSSWLHSFHQNCANLQQKRIANSWKKTEVQYPTYFYM